MFKMTNLKFIFNLKIKLYNEYIFAKLIQIFILDKNEQ